MWEERERRARGDAHVRGVESRGFGHLNRYQHLKTDAEPSVLLSCGTFGLPLHCLTFLQASFLIERSRKTTSAVKFVDLSAFS